jgi:hypothetical protein
MFGRAAIAVVLLSGLSAPAWADAESEGLLRQFVDGINGAAGWSATVGAIRSDGSDTIASNLLLSREEPHVAVRIGEIRATDLAARDGGGFTASTIALTDANVDAEVIAYTIPSATVQDLSVPSVEGIVYDPRHMMSFVAKLYSAAAESEFSDFSIPEMRSTQSVVVAGVANRTEVVYRNVSSTGLEDGVLESSSLGPVTFTVDAVDAEPVTFEIAEISAERFDIEAAAHILDPARYRDGRGDDIWRPLLSRVTYSGMSGKGENNETFRLDELTLEGLDGHQTEKPMLAIWDQILDPTVSEDAKADLALDAIRRMYSAWRFGNIRIAGLAVDAGTEGSFGVESFTVTGLSDVGIDSILLKAVQAETPQGFFEMQGLELAGFKFPDLDALMTFAGLENDATAMAKEEVIRTAFQALPRLSHFAMSGIAAGQTKTDAVLAREFSIDLADWNELFAASVDIRLAGVEVPRHLMELDAETRQMLDALGYDRLVFGMSFADRWAPDAGTTDMTVGFTLETAMDAELTYTITGVTKDWVYSAISAAGQGADGSAALMAMAAQLGLGHAQLKVTDRSILDRAFGIAAQKQGLAIEGAAYREQMRGALPFLLSAAAPPDLVKLLTDPMKAFLAGGQTLVAEIAPPQPIPLLDLAGLAAADPMTIPGKIGLTLRSESP